MKIFVTQGIPEVGITKLKDAGHEVVISEKNGVLTKEELLKALAEQNPDAVLCLLTDKIDAEVFRATPQAKIFANYAVGFDNIDLEAGKAHNITITNTPDVLTEAVAEHTVALIVSLGRRIVESDSFARAGKYQNWDPFLLLGMEFKGKTLGIVGGGRIGSRVAEIMHKGFGMSVVYHDQQQNDWLNKEVSGVFKPALDELLKEADVVSIHLPLNPETKHLFRQERLSLMKQTALLINTARGAIVDEAALAKSLKDSTIAGAALDVFENEPDINPELVELSNVILTPHTASATKEARDQMSIVAADNIIAVLSGKPPVNSVM